MADSFRHTNERYAELEKTALRAIGLLALQVRMGSILPAAFGAEMATRLKEWHPEAASVGRVAAGGEPGVNDLDKEIGDAAAEKESRYFDGFVDDIEAGRYDDEMTEDAAADDPSALSSRAELYGMALLGTAMAGWAKAQAEETEINWQTSDAPCEGCQAIAAGNPYTSVTLPTYPGAGDTICLSRCRCFLET